MAKWGYLARANAILEYAYMKYSDAQEGDDPIDESFEAVAKDIKYILNMAEDTYISARETPYEYRTIKQCKKWLKDFGNGTNKTSQKD